MKLGTEFGFKHAANGNGQELQNENRARRHHCIACITRVTIELTSSEPPLLHQLSDVKPVELPSRSPYRCSTSGFCCLDGNRVQILHGAPGDKCRVHISGPAVTWLDGEELRREIKVLFPEARSQRLGNVELCLKAYDPRVTPEPFGDPVSDRTPSRTPKSECNVAGLLWNVILVERDTRLLIRVELDRPFLAGRGVRSVKDVFRLRALALRELISPREMEMLPLPSAFTSSPEELAEEFEVALQELIW